MIVIPSVSFGNVPQLALDLLTHTYDFKLVTSLDDENLSPFIGPMDHAANSVPAKGVATAAQLFRLGDNYLVQLRSPPLTGKKSVFLQTLSDQLRELVPEQSKIIIAGSSNVGMSESYSKGEIIEVTSSNGSVNALYGSGYVKEALEQFPGSVAEVIWVHEGDNFDDAESIAKKLVDLLKLDTRPFKQPVSWSRVYGKDVPTGIEHGLYT